MLEIKSLPDDTVSSKFSVDVCSQTLYVEFEKALE